MIDKYRVENKGNVNYNGPKTSYKLFEYDDSQGAYLFVYRGIAPGWNATDNDCILDYELTSYAAQSLGIDDYI